MDGGVMINKLNRKQELEIIIRVLEDEHQEIYNHVASLGNHWDYVTPVLNKRLVEVTEILEYYRKELAGEPSDDRRG
jgi:hypothetical protein